MRDYLIAEWSSEKIREKVITYFGGCQIPAGWRILWWYFLSGRISFITTLWCSGSNVLICETDKVIPQQLQTQKGEQRSACWSWLCSRWTSWFWQNFSLKPFAASLHGTI